MNRVTGLTAAARISAMTTGMTTSFSWIAPSTTTVASASTISTCRQRRLVRPNPSVQVRTVFGSGGAGVPWCSFIRPVQQTDTGPS